MSTHAPARRAAARAAALLIPAVLFVSSAVAPVSAHDPGLSALDVTVGVERVTVTLSLAAADARACECQDPAAAAAFAAGAIAVKAGGGGLAGSVARASSDAGSVAVTLTYPRAVGELRISSRVAARLAPGHRQLLSAVDGEGRPLMTAMLDARHDAVAITVVPDRDAGLVRFVRLGLHHILTGYDHLLFLAALLLGVRRFRDVLTTVTAFTAAHSLTLALAVLGIAHAPAALVEPLIAASIVFVGVENLVRDNPGPRWKLTFAFGLVHGFGFAGALQELGITGASARALVALGGFNAGVELGQIASAAVLWPIVVRLEAAPLRRYRPAPACSAAVAAAGACWLILRIANLR